MRDRGGSRQGPWVRAFWRRASTAGAGAVLMGTAFVTWAGSPASASPHRHPATASQLPSMAFDPTSLDFGSVAVGQQASEGVTLSNGGGSATGALTLSVSGSSAFSLTADGCTGTSLGPAKSCTAVVQFAPGASGVAAGVLTAVSTRGMTATSTLSGSVGSLYWANTGNGDISVAGLDGSNAQNLVSGQSTPTGLAVSSTNLYWADYGSGSADGAIMSANLDGGNVQTLVSGVQQPVGVAVSSTNLYWTEASAGIIVESGLDGSNPEAIVTGLSDPAGLAVAGGQLYWTDIIAGTVNVANLDGSNPQVLVSGLSEPVGVAVANGHVYWASFGLVDSSIGESNLDGSNVQTLVGGESFIEGVAADSGHVYWTNAYPDGGSTITEANLDGSNPQVIVTHQDQPFGLVVTG